MAKKIYVCSNCGAEYSKWYGKCPSCGEWGSLEEVKQPKKGGKKQRTVPTPVKLSSVNVADNVIPIYGEFGSFFENRLSKGGVYLISGTPGIGKSTFLLQIAKDLKQSNPSVVYFSAEESLGQLAQRAKRLKAEDIEAISENRLENIVAYLETEKVDIAIIDSIHTVFSTDVDYAVGGVQQVRYCAEKLVETAKSYDITVFIVAHITKSGMIAGPKTLEHMVDAVLLLEGDKNSDLRVLKFTKNRFGSTEEALILEMNKEGLKKVKDPTLKFLERREFTDGICYGATVEGKYPIVLEVQALCVQTPLAMPRRVSVGFDINRLNMILAVLERRLSIPFFKYDVYVNITGGIKVNSTSIDAAVATALLSSIKKSSLNDNTVAFSEIDLTGRLRLFGNDRKVLKQLEDMGFKIISALTVKNVKQLYEFI